MENNKIEIDLTNEIVKGIHAYSRDIYVVNDLLSVNGDFDSYAQVKASLSSSSQEVKSWIVGGKFTVQDSGEVSTININKVFLNNENDDWMGCKIVWLMISFKTKKSLDLSGLLNRINENVYLKYNKIYYYGVSLQPKSKLNKKFCDLFFAIVVGE